MDDTQVICAIYELGNRAVINTPGGHPLLSVTAAAEPTSLNPIPAGNIVDVCCSKLTVNDVEVTPVEFQTDSVSNDTQDVLNLIAGTNITLTADGSGGVTIDATGGGGGDVTNPLSQGLDAGGFGITNIGGLESDGNVDFSLSSSVSLPGGGATQIGGATPATLEQAPDFSNGLSMFVGTAGQFSAIADATDAATAISQLNLLLAALRTRGDLAI